jgi:ligand-binding SRPBCC domain-containing protein
MITLSETTLIAAPIDRCFDLSRSIAVHLAANTHFGEQAVVPDSHLAAANGLLTLGDDITWRARHFLIRQSLTTRITLFDPPHSFQDTMVQGPFHSMQHDHHFQAILSEDSAALTAMHDTFRFSAPVPLLGRAAETLFLRSYIQSVLRQRNAILKQIAESPANAWQQYLAPAAAQST